MGCKTSLAKNTFIQDKLTQNKIEQSQNEVFIEPEQYEHSSVNFKMQQINSKNLKLLKLKLIKRSYGKFLQTTQKETQIQLQSQKEIEDFEIIHDPNQNLNNSIEFNQVSFIQENSDYDQSSQSSQSFSDSQHQITKTYIGSNKDIDPNFEWN